MDYASGACSDPANPGAIHEFGVKAKKRLNEAREEIAGILGAHSDEIIFTSGATESNNLVILGVLKKYLQNFSHLPHIVTTNIEHASVLEVCKYLEKTKQAEITFVPVESNGIVSPEKIKKALKKNTILVSVMYANNEIGTIQPIREIAKEIRHFRKTKNSAEFSRVLGRGSARPLENSLNFSFPIFHTDATQAINYLPINVEKLGVDLLSFNGLKIYGPSGVGVLYEKRNTPISSIMFGGDQERGLRPGTENINGIIALAKALKITEQIKDKEVKRLTKLRDYFTKKLLKFNFVVNGSLENRLPNNINITIPKTPSDLLVIELSAKGIMASVKSACKSGDEKSSHVIQAIREAKTGKSLLDKEVDGSIRFSLGRQTTKADIDYTVKALSQILTKLKKWY